MKRNRLWSVPIKVLLTLSIVTLGFTGCNDIGNEEPLSPQQRSEMMVLSKDNPGIQRAMEVQDKYTSALMRSDGVVGTATGVDEDGTPIVLVLTETKGPHNLPTVLEGVPVRQRTAGHVVAYQFLPGAKGGNPGPPGGGGGGGNGGGGNGGGGKKINPKDYFSRPVPIGVSTGNSNECASGTIGCRVKDANGTVYALSNNHVFARMNAASNGEILNQPGVYDRRCRPKSGDAFASLADYYQMSFNGGTNTMDAAIGETTTANLGNGTPSNGYGVPSSTPVAPGNYAVQKYGRTTGHTHGTITGINMTVNVDYGSAGIATFTGQVYITPGTFSSGGDSGSLIVTDDANANPVALLFAGSSFLTIATPIQTVLNEFNVTIDGK